MVCSPCRRVVHECVDGLERRPLEFGCGWRVVGASRLFDIGSLSGIRHGEPAVTRQEIEVGIDERLWAGGKEASRLRTVGFGLRIVKSGSMGGDRIHGIVMNAQDAIT